MRLREELRTLLQNHGLGLNELRLLDILFQVNIGLVSALLDVVPVTAIRLVDRLADLGILTEITGRQRNRVFRYAPYWQLFQEPEPPEDGDAPFQTTESGAVW